MSEPEQEPAQEPVMTIADAAKILTSRGVQIYIATPCYGCSMTARYAASLIRLQALAIRHGIQLTIDHMGNESLIPRARNIYCGRFLKSPSTHLLFIDSDIGFDPSTVIRMLLHDKDVVTAIYPKKGIDWDMVKRKVERGDEEPVESMGLDFNINLLPGKLGPEDIVNGFVRALDAPTGMMLISRDALQRVSDHYREDLLCVNDLPGSRDIVPEYVGVFDCMRCPQSKRALSEDFAFCRRAQELGIEIWADLASPLIHTGIMAYSGNIASRFVAQYVG